MFIGGGYGRHGCHHIKIGLTSTNAINATVNKITSSISSRGRVNSTKLYVINKH